MVESRPIGGWICGRIKGVIYRLQYNRRDRSYLYCDETAEALLGADSHDIVSLKLLDRMTADHLVDIGVYHTLHHLCDGVLDPKRINQVNAGAISMSEAP